MRILTVVILAVALVAAPACTKKPEVSAGIDLAGMDTSVAPGDDFNAYTNGGWIKATPIPADKSSYGVGAILVDERQEAYSGAHPGIRQCRICRKRGCPEDRRFLFELHG